MERQWVSKSKRNLKNSRNVKAALFVEHLVEIFTPENNDQVQVDQILEKPAQAQQPIKLFTPKEITEIISTFNPTKKHLINVIKVAIKLLYVLNAILRSDYNWSKTLSQIIMIPNRGNTQQTSHQISILPTISKLLVRFILNKINSELNPQKWMLEFRQNNSTIQQYHRIVNIISQTLKNQQYCTAAFLDITQAFDKVSHPALLSNVKRAFPSCYTT